MASAVLLSSLATGIEWLQIPGEDSISLASSRLVYVYKRGTTTQVQVYSDSGLSVPVTQPVTTGSSGVPGGIPGYIAGDISVDFVDVASGARTEAEPLVAADLVGTDGTIGGPGSLGLFVSAISQQGTNPTAVKTSAYSAVAADEVRVDISGGSVATTLPTAPPDRTRIGLKIVKVSGTPGSTSATLVCGGSDVFNMIAGSTTLTFTALFQGAILQYHASDSVWVVQNTDTPLGVALGAAKLGTDNAVGGPSGSPLTTSIALTGHPTGVTEAPLDNSTKLASTAYADALRTATATLTNKRVTERTVTVNAPGATPTINTDNCDVAAFTGLATAITSMTTNLSGTPGPNDQLLVELTDNGTARAITWGASFEASTIALPTTTAISALLCVQFLWNTATSKWRVVGTA